MDMLKTYGYRRYDCGCVCSLSKTGERQGMSKQCQVSGYLSNAQIMDKRPQTKQMSAEWRVIWNAHFKEEDS